MISDMNPFKVWSISFEYESTEWVNVRHLPASCCGVPTFLIYLECSLFAYLIRTHPFKAFSPVTSHRAFSDLTNSSELS